MAITKTNFINYSRCPRYAALEEIKCEKLDADITYKEYKHEEESEQLKENKFSKKTYKGWKFTDSDKSKVEQVKNKKRTK